MGFLKSNNGKRNGYHTLGFIVIIMALIGLISVINLGYRVGSDLIDNRAEKSRYERFLRPVVMFDPAPFNNPQNADANFILQAAMWSVLMGENFENYGYDDIGLLIVPASDLDVEAARLFGPEVKLEHRTFDDYSVSYLYESEIKAYHVPLEPRAGYTPRVTNIVKRNGSIYLKVGYISPDNIIFFGNNDDEERIPDKFLVYQLKDAKKENQYIESIQFMDESGLFN